MNLLKSISPHDWCWRGFRLLPVAAYLGLAITMGWVIHEQDNTIRHIEELRKGRVLDQAISDEKICDRQEVVTERLIDTKRKIRQTNRRIKGTDKILHTLIVSVTQTPNDDDSNRKALKIASTDLKREVIALNQEQAALKAGERILIQEQKSVDCNRLPSKRPFEE